MIQVEPQAMNALTEKFQNLEVWRKAHNLVSSIYDFSSRFPHSEFYELTTPMRLSAVSVSANIMEGYRKKSRREQVRLLGSARASLEKTRHYLLVSGKLNFGDTSNLIIEVNEVAQLLSTSNGISGIIQDNKVQ